MFRRFLALSFIAPLVTAQFYLYPPISPTYLAASLNVTTDCLAVLNTTLPSCDPTLTSMLGSIDDFLWQDDNVTTICNGNCTAQLDDWNFNVQYYCYGQTLNVGGKLVPADSVSGRYLDNINLACLPSNDGQWCLVKSLNWTGSDIVRPDCTVTPSDPQCQNATNVNLANQRLANLYGNDILCDRCFVKMLQARVQSPFLPDTDYSEFLVDQLQDVADICNVTTLGVLSTRPLFSYAVATTTTSQVFGNATTSTMTSVSASATCTGQVLSAGAHKRFGDYANVHNRAASPDEMEKRQTSNCNSLSQKYGVTTGDLQTATGSTTCTITGSVCVPLACSLQQVPANATCDSLAAALSNSNLTVTTQLFLGWNRNIQGLCNAVTPGQYYCVSAPGGTYKVAPPPLGTDANAGNQQRGGQGGVVTPTTTVSSTVNSVSQGAGPTATQSGIAKNCVNYAMAKSGDDCYDFAVNHSITPAQLYQWNTILGPNGQNCSLQFQAQEYYCIGVANTTSTTTTAAGAPGPTQSGIISSCNKYATPPSGQGCYDFATANNVTPSQLYYWNSVLGPNGQNCSTQFQKGEYYCVGVSGSTAVPTTTTTTTATRSTPSPVQSGIVSNCNRYALPKSGEGCYDFANDNGITTTQLYTWNPVLGNNGQNCGTQFQAGEYYCVGVSS